MAVPMASSATGYVSAKSVENRFVWRAQYFCVVFKSVALWRHPLSFCVAGAAIKTCRVACFFAHVNLKAASSVDNVQIRGSRGKL